MKNIGTGVAIKMPDWDEALRILGELNEMCDGVEAMAKEAEGLKDSIIEIRKRSEAIEGLVAECLQLMDE